MSDPRLEQFERAIKYARMNPQAWPNELYHYTTAPGFEGIVRSRSVRATNFSFMNDPSEITYGRDFIAGHLRATLAGVPDPDVRAMLEGVADTIVGQPLPEIYVASFTYARDDLSQWRAYGGSPARYALGFRISDVYAATTRDHPHFVRFSRVLYDVAQQDTRVTLVLDAAVEFLLRNPAGDLRPYAAALTQRLYRMLPTLKHPSYRDEREFRVIILLREGTPAPLQFDTSRGVIRPYLLFELTAGPPLPLANVLVLAPGRTEVAVKAARLVLASAGIAGVQVQPSDIPFAE